MNNAARLCALSIGIGLAASTLQAQPFGGRPIRYAVPHPAYVTIPLQVSVDRPAADVWRRIGKYCDLGAWLQVPCTIQSGDGGVGTVRSVGHEILVGKTALSYTYTQPVRLDRPYNLYHGTLEARPTSPTTSMLLYTLVYDNSMLPDDAARQKDKAQRAAMFTRALQNMKVLAEGGTLAAPTAPAPLPNAASIPYATPHPTYEVITLDIEVNRPAAEVWKRVGKFCDIGEWLQAPCTVVSGGGGMGSLRTLGGAVYVGGTALSMVYAQRVRADQPYDLWHGTIEAGPLSAKTSKIIYTLLYDSSALPPTVDRQTYRAQRTAMFMRVLKNMKILAEGGTLPPPPPRPQDRGPRSVSE